MQVVLMTKTTSGACAKINQVDINEGPREESAIVPVPPALVVAGTVVA
jgi:hypothetical protein